MCQKLQKLEICDKDSRGYDWKNLDYRKWGKIISPLLLINVTSLFFDNIFWNTCDKQFRCISFSENVVFSWCIKVFATGTPENIVKDRLITFMSTTYPHCISVLLYSILTALLQLTLILAILGSCVL